VTSSSTETLTLVDVPMPAMGTSIVEGTVIAWSKNVGDPVSLDETICEVSTDKVDTDCPSPVGGTVAELLVEVGETVAVGTAIARVAVDGGGPVTSPAPDLATLSPVADQDRTTSRAQAKTGLTASGGRVSPVVARIAAHHGLDLSQIVGTGRNGRVTKQDVLGVVNAGVAEVATPEPPLHSESPYRADPELAVTAVVTPATTLAQAGTSDDLGGVSAPLSRMRKSIGEAMLRSQAVSATCHTVVECDMSRIEARRRELGVTALPLVARAVIDTLHAFPDLNATLNASTITRFERVHLGIAVSLAADGLIVPVIKDAQNLAPEGLGAAIKDLAGRARARNLSPDEVRGATFTITNPGAFGASIATPVLDVPQVGILDLEAIIRRPVVITDADGNESIAIRPMVNLVLGWDHRAMDGIYAAQFLTALRVTLESS
jgi:pyruvate/2-oxoglutarate dehydrogenase complex dihydrolipoamide acyltransferase (E2) component